MFGGQYTIYWSNVSLPQATVSLQRSLSTASVVAASPDLPLFVAPPS